LNKNDSIESPYLNDENYKSLISFIKMDLLKDYIDIVYVFKVEPKISIEREYSNLLTDKRGSIMRESTLKSFSESVDNVINTHKQDFREVITIDTGTKENNQSPNVVSYNVTKSILDTLRMLLIEKVGFFNKSELLDNGLKEGVNEFSLIKNASINYKERDFVENSLEYIQPLPIVVITNKEKDKVLVVKKSTKKTSKDSPERNKTLLYLGGHIRQEDSKNSIDKTITKSLRREIYEEIGESINVENVEPFLIYTPTYSSKSEKHLAICYVVEMDLLERKFKLTSDEHVMKTGKSISGHTMTINTLVQKERKNLESWSIEILKKVFNIKNLKQPELFKE
jgi:predicted NUDIX family phosphoesterase